MTDLNSGNRKIKVLVACEFSGVVKNAFTKVGCDAWSCDLLPSEIPENHIQDDVLNYLDMGWDILIAFPPCTHLAVSGAAHFKKKYEKQKKALDFFLKCLNAPVPSICVENPISIASTYITKPTQIIHPWQFGDSYNKSTCLWLKNLPKLKPTKIVDKGEFITFWSKSDQKLKRYAKWNYEARWKEGSKNHGKARSRTFQGIAEAMADQWGRKLHNIGFINPKYFKKETL